MSDMNRIIHAQSNSEDKVNAGYDVNGYVPEVQESNDVSESKDYNEVDHDTDADVS